MKKIFIGALSLLFLFSSNLSALAVSPQSAKQVWLNAKKERIAAEVDHNQAKLDFQENQSVENDQKVIKTGKEVLDEVLDEAASWLSWKKAEAEANPYVTEEIRDNILRDVDKNLFKIEELRNDVDQIENRLQLVTVFIKMVGSYLELLTDVARNSGALWSLVGDNLIKKTENFENKLRSVAEKLDDNAEIMSILDLAKEDLEKAKVKVGLAKESYKQITNPGTPIIKFAEGNNYLRAAKSELLNAHGNLEKAFRLILNHDE